MGFDLRLEQFGKPERVSFSYCERLLSRLVAQRTGATSNEIAFEPSNILMIGDNPAADIRGANRANWYQNLGYEKRIDR